MQAYPMDDDRVVGDGGGITVYARPDASRYALFDSRHLADGRWPGSRSVAAVPAFA